MSPLGAGPVPVDVVWTPLRSPWRWPLAAATAVTAVAHVPVIGPHLHEAPYMGEEFIVLTLACLALGIAALICDSPAVYGLTIATCGLAIFGFVATRLIAFPSLGDDVGNWLEPLAVLSVMAEGAAAAAAVKGLRAGARRSAAAR
ncbi:MAG TPA: hypothetical protein VHS52_07205 [Acidimicrobiales bacterium]|nr:hypothetical protein [Acidimicrobiales bacterium]